MSNSVSPETEIRTSLGVCQGFVTEKSLNWRGIRYAKIPKRFIRSVPLDVETDAWEGVRECTKFGDRPVQPRFDSSTTFLMSILWNKTVGAVLQKVTGGWGSIYPALSHMSEDCLFLNIIAPRRKPGNEATLLPVVVWIHGGGFTFGSGGHHWYRSETFAEEDVVLVTINYRLGVHGFLNLPEGDFNCGLWDQYMALRWVHQEIKNFGGDPDNVTIAGQSAGGMSCGALLTSPLTQPYFQRAILMSGACCNVLSTEDALLLSETFCRQALPNGGGIKELRMLSSDQLLAAQREFVNQRIFGVMPFQPCVDGDLIVSPPLVAIRQGLVQLQGKQVILGSTSNEWQLFKPPWLNVFGFPKSLGSMGGSSINDVLIRASFNLDNCLIPSNHRETRALLKALRRDNNLENWDETLTAFYSWLVFSGPERLSAKVLAGVSGMKVWVYKYDFDAGLFGSAHAAEVPVLFGTWNADLLSAMLAGSRNEPEACAALSKQMAASFAAFARSGSPRCPLTSEWCKCYSNEERNVFLFDRESRLINDTSDSSERFVELLAHANRPFGLRLSQVESKL